MGTPVFFKISKDNQQLLIERSHPSKSHLYWQGFTALGVVGFFIIFIIWYSIDQLEATALLRIEGILFLPLIYIGLSLISTSWRTKETIVLDRNLGLLTYTKLGKHPWLFINRGGTITSPTPFVIEYLYFPLGEITSVHSMTVDTVDEFNDYLVFYFGRLDTYMAVWEYSFESSKVGYKVIEEVAQFLGQQLGQSINEPPLISFNLSFLNDLFRSVSQKRQQGIKIDSKKAFSSYDQKLAMSAALTQEENYRIIKRDQNNAYAYLLLGLAYLGQGSKEAAFEYLQVAYRLFIALEDKRHAKRVMRYLSALKTSAVSP